MIVTLDNRGVVEVTGEDRIAFLQGLVSNDVAQAAPGRAVWAALLTPQGKWLADFFVLADGERLLLDCAGDQAAMLVRVLSRYRLRAKVVLRDASDALQVAVAWGETPDVPGAIIAPDPRLPEAGFRVLTPQPPADTATEADWQTHRISLGLPDGAHDMEGEKSVLLEAGFDELGGVSWTKGCYMGQELTARTKYRGLVKRRLVPVLVQGTLPPPGTPILRDGQEIGVLRFGLDSMAMALIRSDALSAAGIWCCDRAVLTPRLPAWLKAPAAREATTL